MRVQITFILMLAGIVSASAQTFDYGIKAGPNLNYFSVKYEPDPKGLTDKGMYGPRTAFHAGLFMSIDLTDRISYRQEVEYIRKGGRQNPNPSQNVLAATTNISYLQFPVLLAWQASEKLFIEAGPAFAFHLSTKSDQLFYWGDRLHEDFEISALGGIRYKAAKRIDLQARYSLGLTNVAYNVRINFQDPDTGESVMSELYFKNRSLSLSILYYFQRLQRSE